MFFHNTILEFRRILDVMHAQPYATMMYYNRKSYTITCLVIFGIQPKTS